MVASCARGSMAVERDMQDPADARGDRRCDGTAPVGRVGPGGRTARGEPVARPGLAGPIARTAFGIAALGCLMTAAGCQYLSPVLVSAGLSACVELVKSLLDEPEGSLPAGFRPCGTTSWTVQGHTAKFCTYCDPSSPSRVYIQFDCEGKFYPMDLRNPQLPSGLENPPAEPEWSSREDVHLVKYGCDEVFLIKVWAEVAPDLGYMRCDMSAPNDRILPDPSAYPKLSVVTGGQAAVDGDTRIPAGCRIALEGPLDEVAHYAMTAGITELSFEDGTDDWQVHVNPDMSAAMIFRNGIHHETRLLFAPRRRL